MDRGSLGVPFALRRLSKGGADAPFVRSKKRSAYCRRRAVIEMGSCLAGSPVCLGATVEGGPSARAHMGKSDNWALIQLDGGPFTNSC